MFLREKETHKPGNTDSGWSTCVERNGGGSGGNCGSGPFEMEDGGDEIIGLPFAAITCKRPPYNTQTTTTMMIA